ncbi:hypothetical protein Lal_00000994 [Lupinus albus]|nr:hypothetical protein Lal_00000994 [Lupinus albus]
MWHVRDSQSPLPYAIFITKILEHFGIPLEGETKVALNLRESKVDIEVVHTMGLIIDAVTRRTYKHRTDRQPAPTDELEPTAEPNQPESHAPSSSSAAMPTTQMIMDELVSLRGYITTRMDAFDTQSQQIHYELHRLSSRLSNMDVDEDSSEPELLAFLLFDEVKRGRKVGRCAHNSNRKGEHTCIHIGGHTQDKSRYIIKYAALIKLHFQEDIGLSSSKKRRFLLLTLARNLLPVKSTGCSLRWTRRNLARARKPSLEQEWSRLSENCLSWARRVAFRTCRGCKIFA